MTDEELDARLREVAEQLIAEVGGEREVAPRLFLPGKAVPLHEAPDDPERRAQWFDALGGEAQRAGEKIEAAFLFAEPRFVTDAWSWKRIREKPPAKHFVWGRAADGRRNEVALATRKKDDGTIEIGDPIYHDHPVDEKECPDNHLLAELFRGFEARAGAPDGERFLTAPGWCRLLAPEGSHGFLEDDDEGGTIFTIELPLGGDEVDPVVVQRYALPDERGGAAEKLSAAVDKICGAAEEHLDGAKREADEAADVGGQPGRLVVLTNGDERFCVQAIAMADGESFSVAHWNGPQEHAARVRGVLGSLRALA